MVGKKTLDDHSVNVQWFKGKVAITVPIPETLKVIRPRVSWKKASGCRGKVVG